MSINDCCMEMTLNSPITEEQWDAITDVDFEHTNRIWFHTKHGKDVEFAKVVRCKDCKWWDKVDNIDGVNYGTCERKCTAIRKDAFPNENWFCADGERREE